MNLFTVTARILNQHSDIMNIDIIQTWLYTLTEFDEQKNQVTKRKYFDYNQKKHLHKDYLTNSFYKLQSTASINSRKNQSDIQNKKTYTASVISIATSQN